MPPGPSRRAVLKTALPVSFLSGCMGVFDGEPIGGSGTPSPTDGNEGPQRPSDGGPGLRSTTDLDPGWELFVSPDGDDANDGSEEQPLASMSGARDRLRERREEEPYPEDGVAVTLRGGTYRRTSSISLGEGGGSITFGEGDGGTPEAPVVYRGHPDESVRIAGGVELPTQDFEPVTGDIRSRLEEDVRDHVVQFDLAAHDIDGYGAIEKAGFGVSGASPPPDLFVDHEPMRLARWPDDGWMRVDRVRDEGGVPGDGGAWKEGAVFEYDHDRPERWATVEDVWMLGYWGRDWAHGILQIESIDVESRVIETRDASYYGVREDQPYYYFNVPEEITEQGEYYIDTDSEVLYLYPPDGLEDATVEIAVMRRPLIRVQNASNLTFANMTIGTARDRALAMNNCTGVTIERCELRNLAGDGVHVLSAERCGIFDSEVHTVGRTAIVLQGGNRTELTPGRNHVENTGIHTFGRFERTYAPGISVSGVGNSIRHNRLRNAPHAAIFFSGNEHLIENNEIDHVGQEASDVGAIYNGRDWTERGTTIRHNFIHHLGNDLFEGVGQIGVYFDDLLSGNRAEGNVFYAVDRAMHIGGGRHVDLINNLIVDCTHSISFDQRGAPGEWRENSCRENSALMQGLEAVPHREDPWASQYPELVDVLADDPCLPKHNRIERNAVVGSPSPKLDVEELVRKHGTIEDNFVQEINHLATSSPTPHGFDYDPQTGEASLAEDNLAAAEIDGWEPIPLDDVGPR